MIDDMLATYEFLAHKRETEIRVILSGKATSYFVTDQEQFVDIVRSGMGKPMFMLVSTKEKVTELRTRMSSQLKRLSWM